MLSTFQVLSDGVIQVNTATPPPPLIAPFAIALDNTSEPIYYRYATYTDLVVSISYADPE